MKKIYSLCLLINVVMHIFQDDWRVLLKKAI